ncbi:Ig-like domain repeat protein [Actinoplanes sp. NBRC 103695]|uniref:Ig-like domain repeat protein n=1 Tax=Actinoplanes sp. NBRC 103695 TaxID=3032202 RepID=UPI002557598D|nr:Ig-like domain repeat protein [Actinoplanes sp. NBRC 103695]
MAGSTGTATVTVNPAATSTAVTASPDPSVSGEPVEVCAVVTVEAPGSGTPTGTVTLTGPGGLNQTVALDGTGEGCLTTATLATGTVTGTYNGDSGRAGSTGTVSVTVDPAATTTTVVSAPEPSVTGESVEVCATVATTPPGSGTPTGSVTFTGPGGLNQTVALDGAGEACITTTSLATGTVTATYGGDSVVTGSTGTASVTVNPADTSTAVTATPDPSVTSESVEICTAVTVTAPGTGMPTGTVTFTGPGGLNQTVALDGAGEACITTTSLATGTVTATYNGDSGMAGSTGTAAVTVNPAPTTTTVLTAVRTGASVELCATVTFDAAPASLANSAVALIADKAGRDGAVSMGGSGAPTGTVTFTGLGGLNQTAVLDSDGKACVTVTDVAGGTATATYSGDAGIAGSTDTETVPPSVPSAPGNVTAVGGVSSVVVSWQPPSTGAAVTGYTATAGPGPAVCTTTGETSCLLGGTAGTTYTVTVVAHSAVGDSPASEPSNEVTVVAPTPPSEPPTTDLTLTTTDGDITVAEPGQRLVFIGTGFAPFSTVVVTLYSEPVLLGSFTTNAIGSFEAPVTLPENLSAGKHTVAAQGIAPDGSPRAMVLTVSVGGGAGLPVTGPSVSVLLLSGILLAMGGTGLVAVGRPRRRVR